MAVAIKRCSLSLTRPVSGAKLRLRRRRLTESASRLRNLLKSYARMAELWWCGASLCAACGDGLGHCGHPGADKANQESASLKGYEDRRVVAAHIERARANLERACTIFGLPEPGRPKPN